MKNNIKRKIKYTKLFQKYRYIQGIPKTQKVYFDKENKLLQYKEILKDVKINLEPEKVFQHWIDQEIHPIQIYAEIGNIPPDYTLILEHSIDELIKNNLKNDNQVSKQNYELLIDINNYIVKIISEMSKYDETSNDFQMSLKSFEAMKTDKANSLFDALQRINPV